MALSLCSSHANETCSKPGIPFPLYLSLPVRCEGLTRTGFRVGGSTCTPSFDGQDELETDYLGAWAYSVKASPIGDDAAYASSGSGFVSTDSVLLGATLFTAGLRVT